jgi:hypothetical protein
MRPRSFLFLLALVARPVISQPYFVYPPAFVATTDFSQNIVMVEGDYKVVQWANVSNPNNYRISVTMFQLNGTQFLPGDEYIIRTPILHPMLARCLHPFNRKRSIGYPIYPLDSEHSQEPHTIADVLLKSLLRRRDDLPDK